jgi:hypothetical protein
VITTALLSIGMTLLGWATGWLPSWSSLDLATPIASIFATIAPLSHWFGWLDNYVPLHEAVEMLGVLIAMYAAAQLYSAAIWLLSKLHILGGGST